MDRDPEACMSRRPLMGADGAFNVVQRTVGRQTILAARGELTHSHAPELARAVHHALATKPQPLVIDLDDVALVDWHGLFVLLNARRRSLRLGVELSLACEVPATLRLLARMPLDRDFDILPSPAEALSQRNTDA